MPTIDLGNVVGPQGPQGVQGIQGPRGTQGEIGPNQVTGSTATTLNGVLFGNGSAVSAKALDSSDGAASTASVALKAPLASPALTGTPTAPTAASGTNTTQIATTAFVKTLGDSKAPKNHANAASTYGLGSETKYGHVKLSDATDGTSSVSGGVAATPAAVKAAYDLAAGKQSPETTLAGYGITDAFTKAESISRFPKMIEASYTKAQLEAIAGSSISGFSPNAVFVGTITNLFGITNFSYVKGIWIKNPAVAPYTVLSATLNYYDLYVAAPQSCTLDTGGMTFVVLHNDPNI